MTEEGLAAEGSPRRRALFAIFWLFAANVAAAWLVNLGVLRHRAWGDALGNQHFILAYLSHLALIMAILCAPFAAAAARWPRRWPVLWGLPPVLAVVQFVFFIDAIVYRMVRFHFNPTVLKFLLTPGVEDNIPLSPWQITQGLLIVGGTLAAEHFAARLFWNAAGGSPPPAAGLDGSAPPPSAAGRLWAAALRWLPSPARLRRHAAIGLGALLACAVIEKAVYAWADIKGAGSVLVNARALPFYQPLTFRRLARKMGIEPEQRRRLSSGTALRYPLAPLEPPDKPRRLNVVWIAVEEWRSDSFAPEITPRIWAFGRRCLVAERHYSSGNASRHGIFGLFYGLHGFYWDSFLAERRGPVLFPALKAMGYELRAMGSANFSNPEFRQTCFADLAPGEILDKWRAKSSDSAGKDQEMVRAFADFLAGRDPARPFFAFMFLDAPHSKRFRALPGFDPPFAIDDAAFVSYERLAGDRREQDKTRLRYKNSLAYADFLVGGALDDLERRGLLENTIVAITGDHGEEFGEGGYWGHNSAFDDWQTQVPFILHHPGVRPGRIAKLTAHQDVLPTTLSLLGFTADPAGYCLGRDMLAPGERAYTVAASWNDAAMITADGGRAAFPLTSFRPSTLQVYDGRCQPLPDRDAFLAKNAGRLREVLDSAVKFRR